MVAPMIAIDRPLVRETTLHACAANAQVATKHRRCQSASIALAWPRGL